MLAFRRRSVLPLFVALAVAACSEDDVPTLPVDAGTSGVARVGTVERITDGDTMRLVGVGPVRLIGIDTPEVFGRSECFGREASGFVKRLLRPGDRVRYRPGLDERDRHGRLLAYVWLSNGRMLNVLLAERGYATPLTVPPNIDYAARFAAAARRARDAGRGLWSPRTCGGLNPR